MHKCAPVKMRLPTFQARHLFMSYNLLTTLFFLFSCKPLNDREHNFYRTLPLVLHPYTPKFEGIMSVALHEDENGYITLMGTPPNCYGLKQNRFAFKL